METLAGPPVGALVEVAAARGVRMADLLEVLRVGPDALGAPEHRIPVDRFHAAWEVAVATSGDESLPIAAGRLATVPRYGMLGYHLYTSATVRDAIAALVQFHVVVHGAAAWSFEERDDGGTMTWLRGGAVTHGRALASEQALASFLQIGRELLDGGLGVREAWLERAAPRDERAHREHFGDVIHWSAGRTAVQIARSSLDAAPRGADPLLERFFAERAAIAARKQRESWSGRATRVIEERLPDGIPTLAVVAAALEMSERTLRRRLRENGVRYAALVAQVQRARARDLLAAGSAVQDVAFATGFADASAFCRAYRRWTGTAPSSSRRRARIAASDARCSTSRPD